MTVSHDKKTGQTRITLTWTETRQFISSSSARETLAEVVRDSVKLTTEKKRVPKP
jgi:hypothetical protein